MKRKSGVLMHISTLFGEYSIGSFGEEAKYFINFLSDCGFSYWQVLPFCITDEYNSPYKSYSSFGGNPYFVDLNILYKKGLVTKKELEESCQKNKYICEYERLKRERLMLLIKASKRCENRAEIESFIKERPYLEKLCKFMTYRAVNNDLPWNEWKIKKLDERILFGWKFIQYEFFCQWAEIKEYAKQKGVSIIGDIPIYVSYDSCDVWRNKGQYLLDENDYPTHVAGVPPDYFCTDGQLWGNPIYNWEEMKKDGYKWWKERIRHMSEMFDAIRIDHFRAIESYWAVPFGAKNARNGEWRKGPDKEFVDALKTAAKNSMIIAEDLGEITPEVDMLVKNSGFWGMRVFQFGFLSNDDNLHRPHNYPHNCVAYTGTHDNNTLLGYIGELDEALRRNMLSYCRHSGDWESGCESVIRTMLSSHAGLVIIPIQDLLGHGSDARMNTPGAAGDNWQYRITKDQLDKIDRKKWKYLNKLYSR